ncbi:MAG TPA: ZIP family metal transporter, partial [Methylotenera sp.]|nr:ZIP family metal transporter [Methylotenera sp.]
MFNLASTLSSLSTLSWIILTSLIGGLLSVSLAALFALNVRITWVPMLVSYAIGAM